MEEETILELKLDVEGVLAIHIGNKVGFHPSEELVRKIREELSEHMGGEFAAEFNPIIKRAIKQIDSGEEARA